MQITPLRVLTAAGLGLVVLMVGIFVATDRSLHPSSIVGSITGKRTVLGVIIENHQGAREHHRGLEKALMVQEFLVEGSITRFLVLFDAYDLPPTMGPVRSLRPYFVDSGVPMTHTFLYAGGSPEAFAKVNANEAITGVNGLGHPKEFTRDLEIPAPHNVFINRDDAVTFLPDDATTSAWPPYTTGRALTGTSATVVYVDYFSSVHDVVYHFTGRKGYVRLNGEAMSSANPQNLLFLEMPIQGIGEKGRLTIEPEGEGSALLFRSGKMYKGTWSKADQESSYVFLDQSGRPFHFGGGMTWMAVLPDLGRVTWE